MTDTQARITANCSACGAELPDGVHFCDQCGRGVLAPTASSEPAPSSRSVALRISAGVAALVFACLIAAGVSSGGHRPSFSGSFVDRNNGQSWMFAHGSFTGPNCAGQYTQAGSIAHATCVAGFTKASAVMVLSHDGNVISAYDGNDGACLVRVGSPETRDETRASSACDLLDTQAQSAWDARSHNS